MMSEEEIGSATINAEVAREAFAHAQAYLADVLDNRKAIEQRALFLLAGYLSLAAAIFNAGHLAFWGDKFATVAIMAGVCLLLLSFRPKRYPALWPSPRAWIVPGIIDGSDTALPHSLAHLASQYADRIDLAIAANDDKQRFVKAAVYAGILAILALCLSRVFS